MVHTIARAFRYAIQYGVNYRRLDNLLVRFELFSYSKWIRLIFVFQVYFD